MSEWLTTDIRQLNTAVREATKGVHAELRLSPYDIPQAMRGYRLSGTPWFVIEIKYLNSGEKVKTRLHNEYTAIEVGVESERVYKIKFDVEKLKCKNIALSVVARSALKSLAQDPLKGSRLIDQYRAAGEALSMVQDRLFEEVETKCHDESAVPAPGYTI